MPTFFEQLTARARQINSLLCVGLDPQPEHFPDVEAVRTFCLRLIEQTHLYACAFKPNSAFFEAWGAPGMAVLREVIAAAPAGIPVILDAKRGDIGSTAVAYAQAAFRTLGAGAITLNPYLGQEGIEPFLRDANHGVFILARTSNPSSDQLQRWPLDQEPLFAQVIRAAQGWGSADQIGFVAGATDGAALAQIRRLAAESWLLVPGVGAQGADLEAALRAGLRADGLGVLITVSRAIAEADDPAAAARTYQETMQPIQHTFTPTPSEDEFAERDVVAAALAESGCVKFGQFTLKSGQQSPFYIDLRRLVSYPRQLQVIGRALSQKLAALHFDHIAAIPYAALPIGVASAMAGGYSLIYPRREAKIYGTSVPIEGVFQAGQRALLLDDLATTGETKFEAIERLTSAGLTVKDIMVVIDREQGARATLEAAGYGYHTLATLRQLLPLWQAQGVIGAEQRAVVEAYLDGQK
jgi:uridine monophosphate synthetase